MTFTNGATRDRPRSSSPVIASSAVLTAPKKRRAAKGAAPAIEAAPAPVPVPVPAAPAPKIGKPRKGETLKADRAAAFTEAFALFANVVTSMLPKRSTAKQRAAVDYWCASLANQTAEAWRGKAKAVCVVQGVLPHHELHPMPIGTTETVYADELVSIGLKVVAQADRCDVAALVVELIKTGVEERSLRRLVKKHTKSYPGAHIFSASLS